MSRSVARRASPARAALVAAALTAIACDDGAGPADESSTFDVYVYVEAGDTAGMGPLDEPVRATVTVAANTSDLVLVDSTGSDGHVGFDEVPAGAYTVSHVATAPPPGTTLSGSAVQTVVAPSAGDSVETRFVYRPTEEPAGSIRSPLRYPPRSRSPRSAARTPRRRRSPRRG